MIIVCGRCAHEHPEGSPGAPSPLVVHNSFQGIVLKFHCRFCSQEEVIMPEAVIDLTRGVHEPDLDLSWVHEAVVSRPEHVLPTTVNVDIHVSPPGEAS